jgi:hypothetical protein
MTITTDRAAHDRDPRRQMLRQVRTFWVTGFRTQALAQTAPIALNLTRIAAPDTDIRHDSALHSSAQIAQIYAAANRRLLIRGAPGAGKTILLLDLAEHLLEAAERDATQAIPVVCLLTSWPHWRIPLAAWLIIQLRDQYGVHRHQAQEWLRTQAFVLLLDGLDEVAAPHQAACIAALNRFIKEYDRAGIVVCAPPDAGTDAATIAIPTAVAIQPLDDAQLAALLDQGGAPLDGVRAALNEDAGLCELSRSPLGVTLLARTYQHQRPDALIGAAPEQQRQRLSAAYVQKMAARPTAAPAPPVTPPQTIHWLRWLTGRMIADNQSLFQTAQMQPWWLDRWWQRGLYVLTTTLVTAIGTTLFGALMGLFLGLLLALGFTMLVMIRPFSVREFDLDALMTPGTDLLFRLVGDGDASYWSLGLGLGLLFGLSAGLYSGLIGGLLGSIFQFRPTLRHPFHVLTFSAGLLAVILGWVAAIILGLGGRNGFAFWGFATLGLAGVVGALTARGEIHLRERISWSYQTLQQRWYVGLLYGIGLGLSAALFSEGGFVGLGSGRWLLLFGLLVGLGIGLIAWGIGRIGRRIAPSVIRPDSTPDAAAWQTLRHGIWAWLVFSLGFGMLGGVLVGMLGTAGLALINMPWSFWGERIIFGSIFGSFLGLIGGFFWALGGGPAVGLFCGGLAVVQHGVLRLICTRSGYAPWRYAAFLDACVERQLLYRVGSGYCCIHHTLQDHLAAPVDPHYP